MVLATLAAKTLTVVKEGEAVLVFRLGELSRVARSGHVIAFPFLDRVVRVSLEGIVGWETMPDEKLREKLLEQLKPGDAPR